MKLTSGLLLRMLNVIVHTYRRNTLRYLQKINYEINSLEAHHFQPDNSGKPYHINNDFYVKLFKEEIKNIYKTTGKNGDPKTSL